MQERLKYTFAATGDASGNIEITWEKLKITLPIIIK
jgi:hypothetical protein